MKDELSGEPAWYAVRCVFLSGWSPEPAAQAYEERITLWRAGSADEAIERAEVEAREYAAGIGDRPDTYLGLAQSYWMFDELGDGAEVFSLVRTSELAPAAYLDRHFDTGRELQKPVVPGNEGM